MKEGRKNGLCATLCGDTKASFKHSPTGVRGLKATVQDDVGALWLKTLRILKMCWKVYLGNADKKNSTSALTLREMCDKSVWLPRWTPRLLDFLVSVLQPLVSSWGERRAIRGKMKPPHLKWTHNALTDDWSKKCFNSDLRTLSHLWKPI